VVKKRSKSMKKSVPEKKLVKKEKKGFFLDNFLRILKNYSR